MSDIRSVSAAQASGKRVLVRVDFNVPLSGGRVADDARIRRSLPTLKLLLERGASEIILLSHLGRPEGAEKEEFRMAPVEAHMRTLIDSSRIRLHENLRFDKREEAGDDSFAKELASLGDLFVNDAFSASHRAHASIVGIPKFLPSYAGLLMEEEIVNLSQALSPKRPALAIIGGAKFETKVPLLEKLLVAYDKILIGGALANDLLKSRGTPVGSSLVSEIPVPVSIAGSDRVLSPTDVAVLGERTGVGRTTNTADVRADEKIADIGPQTLQAWSQEVSRAQFVLWNGPVGIYEKGFAEGTEGLARALEDSSARAIVGGGDTEAALVKAAFDATRIFVSTGGGAMLEFLANGGMLPGIEALRR